MASLFSLPAQTALDLDGSPLLGAQLYFYESGTTTPKDVYLDAALTTPASNPVVANVYGQFPPLWLKTSDGTYTVTLLDVYAVQRWSADDVGDILTGVEVGAALWPITDAETSAGLTIADLTMYYEPGNVRRYGATGDGATDDTAALQNALDANNVVFLPAGTYKTTSTLNWHPNQRIYGETHGTSVIAPTSSSAFFALEFDYENEASGPHGCVFENFHVYGAGMSNTTANSVGGIHWTGASHSSVIRNVRFRDFNETNQIGLYITGQVYYLKVEQPEIVDCYTGILLDGDNVTASQVSSCNGIEIYQPRIEMSGATGTTGIALVNAKHTKIVGGYIEQCANFGITADSDSHYTHIDGVWFEQIQNADIRLNGCSYGTIRNTYHYRTTSHTSNYAINLANGGNHHVQDVYAANRTTATMPQPVWLNSCDTCLIEGVYSDLTVGAANVYGGTLGTNRVIDVNLANVQSVSANYQNFIGGLRIGDGTTNDVETLSSVFMSTKSWDPGSVANGASTTTTITVTGAALSDTVIPSFSLSLAGLSLTGYVSGTDTVTVVLTNNTGAPVDLGSGSLRACVIKWA